MLSAREIKVRLRNLALVLDLTRRYPSLRFRGYLVRVGRSVRVPVLEHVPPPRIYADTAKDYFQDVN